MKLEEQVCSLDLAKELKEAGYEQFGLWWWFPYYRGGEPKGIVSWYLGDKDGNQQGFAYSSDQKRDKIVAPTVAELGERLPKRIEFDFYYKVRAKKEPLYEKCTSFICIEYKPPYKSWVISYLGGNRIELQMGGTLSNTFAKMWLYLKKQGLVQ